MIKKVGRPFVYSDACFMAAALFRNMGGGVSYRQLQRVMEDCIRKDSTSKYYPFTRESIK